MAGCAFAPNLGKVPVRIQSLAPESANPSVTLRFINPNNIPLAVAGTEHTLYLNGQLMGAIPGANPVGIPSVSSVSEPIPLPAPVAQAIKQFAAAHPGATPYLLLTTFHLNWHGDVVDWKTSDEGIVTFSGASGTR